MPWIGPRLAPGQATSAGGAETQVLTLSRELVKLGLRVSIAAIRTGDLPGAVDGVAIQALDDYPGRRRVIGKLTEALWMKRFLNGSPGRVVVARGSGPHIAPLGELVRASGRRFIYASASADDFTFAYQPRRRDRLLYARGLRRADAIVVQTHEQQELCRRTVGREPVLIRSIAEPAERGRSREAILWAGRIDPHKCPLMFLELARRVPEASFRMVAVPEPTNARGLMERVRNEAADIPNLELLPAQDRRDLLEMVAGAAAIANTSRQEGLSNVLLEGWARGVPALILSHDPDELVRRHGLGWFAAGSIERLAEQARSLWARRNEQRQLSERCRTYVFEHHSPGAAARLWKQVIQSADR